MEHASTTGDDSHRQNRAFKARLSYWLKKGLPYEIALSRAELRDHLSREPLKLVKALPTPGMTEKAFSPTLENLGLRKSVCQESPSESESLPISRKSERQKICHLSENLLTESRRSELSAVQISWSSPQKVRFEPLNFPASTSDQKDFSKSSFNPVETFLSLTIVVAASWILVFSSAEVFGFTLHGWLKAILLELGILGLFLYESKDDLKKWGSRLASAALICLSFFVLHTGVQKNSAQQLSTAAASSENLTLLRQDRSRLISAHDALPETHVTKRNVLMMEVQKLSDRIEMGKAKASESLEVKVIQSSHMVETLMRLVLIFLNLIFSHRLRASLKGPKPLGV